MLALPALVVLGFDLAVRARLLAEFTPPAARQYALFALIGAALWGSLVLAGARRRGVGRWAARGAIVLLAFFAIGVQAWAALRYGTYFNWRVALQGTTLLPGFSPQLWAQRATLAASLGAPVVVLGSLPLLCRRVAPARPRSARAALAVSAAAFALAVTVARPSAGWDNGAPPDVLYLDATAALVQSRRSGQDVMTSLPNVPGARSPEALGPLVARPARPRNVVVVLTESVRAAEVCSVPRADCPVTPFTNALLPRRLGLSQMRAVASTTAISVAVLLTGLPADADRRTFHSAPLLFEYAHAAGVKTAYFTSQNLLFGNAGLWLDGAPLAQRVTGTEIEPYATYQCGAHDGKVLSIAAQAIGGLPEPFFAVVQLSNTHYPYWIDEADAPFAARGRAERGEAKDERADMLDRYRDAIHRQDRLVADAVRAMRAGPSGGRTVVVFLSDHGEQLHEREQLGHTWSVYDEEIRVPFWVDAPEGTLAPHEEARLRAIEAAPRTTLDVAPTVLDLLGLWEAPALEGPRRRMPGGSLLRGSAPDGPVLLTNCTALASCATRNWGVLRGTWKLAATEDEPPGWRCFDLTSDPLERSPLPETSCVGLRAIAEGGGRGRPWDPR